MNSKTFRRNHGPKLKSSSFISLHFNKSDEDQIEISYKNDEKRMDEFVNKNAFEVSQSNFYVGDTKTDTGHQLELSSHEESLNIESPTSASDSAIKGSVNNICMTNFADDDSEECVKNSFQKAIQCPEYSLETKSNSYQTKQNEDQVDFQKSCVSDVKSCLKLSPAIEAAELVDSDSFNYYINNELEKAKCENLGFEKDENHTKAVPDKRNGKGHFHSVLQNVLSLKKWAQNNVQMHLFFAVLACICAPVPSWFSGFLIGCILSSTIVYWLCKPQKNKKHFYTLNFVSPEVNHFCTFQKESGILKGWMNELPSFMNYTPDKYHVSCTRSVYVRLEGSYLRFSFPQKNIPKRAMFNEPRYEMQFIYQQHFDITNATVQLLPEGLNKKRLWSKKYPICLRVPNLERTNFSQAVKTNKNDKKCVPRINENNEIVIYLFTRTDRDKSLWFSRFLKASKMNTLYRKNAEHDDFFENRKSPSVDFASLQNNTSLEIKDNGDDDNFVKFSLSKQQKFEMYMSTLLLGDKKDLTWINVLLGRVFFDFLVEDNWAQLVSKKIQKKLNRIKLPFFLTELSVKDINLGSALPKIHHASKPTIDEQGLWIDMDVSYNGSFHMTLETKLNLDRFKTDSETFFTASGLDQNEEQTRPSVCDSNEDSFESSSDDEFSLSETNEDSSHKEGSLSVSSSGTSKKFLKLMDKLAQSSYFQHATKNKYVKKAMDDISNTPLILTVEVQWLSGTLAINIPPWPTDRLWYGFRANPSLSIIARPKLGEHVVTFTQITEWIEKKLMSEFQKLLVMPNMDDLIIPIMQDASQMQE